MSRSPSSTRAHRGIMRVIFDHVRPSGRIMPVMEVIEAQSARSWGLTITSITNTSEHTAATCLVDLRIGVWRGSVQVPGPWL